MVRSLARGQFRVTAGWTERPVASASGPVVARSGGHAGSPHAPTEDPPEVWPLSPPARPFTVARPQAYPPGPVPPPQIAPAAAPAPEAPPPPVVEEPRPEVVAPATALDHYRPGPLSRAELAAERAVARGPFRVTFAWAERVWPSPAPIVEPSVAPPPPAPPPPLLAASPVAPTEPEPSKEASDPEPVVAPPPDPTPTPSPPPTGGLDEARRTLVSLLARMWLLRTTASSPSGVALPSPVPPVAPVAPPPVPVAPPAPSEPPVPAPLPGAAERPFPRPTDLDDRRPLSGLASFLVEVADAVRPPPRPEPAPAAVPVHSLLPPRPYHCHAPGAHRRVSRDACRQFRVGR